MSINSTVGKAGWAMGGVAAALVVGATMGFTLRGAGTGPFFNADIPVPDLPEIRGEMVAELTTAPAVPAPITRDYATRVIVDLETTEEVMELADGTEYTMWTFGGTVPGLPAGWYDDAPTRYAGGKTPFCTGDSASVNTVP